MPSARFASFRKLADRFAADRNGAIAVMFAIACVPLLLMVGAAVDYSRAVSARSAMQAALDSAALMVSRDLSAQIIAPADASAAATKYFTALYHGSTDATVSEITASYTASDANKQSTVTISSKASLKSSFMQFANISTLNIGSSSTTVWGNNKLRVALALDNTGSMASDGKIDALKTATTNLLTTLKNTAKNDGDVYVSIIPFATDVNVGTSFSNSYIDWSSWSSSDTVHTLPNYPWSQQRKSCSTYNSTYTMICGTGNKNYWNGCVMDRAQDYDISVDPPATAKFPADQYSPCPTQILPLTYDWSALNAKVTAMTPGGATNQTIGLVWAWQSLVQTLPLSAPAEDGDYIYKRAIILLSDGLNTQNRWDGNGRDTETDVDDRQAKLCTKLKGLVDPKTKLAMYTIYTVQVNTGTPADPTSTVLKNCASSSDKFFMLTSADQLISTFNTIGTSLTQLRISN